MPSRAFVPCPWRHLPLLLTVLPVLAAGCPGEGKWNLAQMDVRNAKEDMTETQVRMSVGEPDTVIPGDGVYIGWEEWVYPNGSIFFHRMRVKEVVTRPKDAPPPKAQTKWPYSQADLEKETADKDYLRAF